MTHRLMILSSFIICSFLSAACSSSKQPKTPEKTGNAGAGAGGGEVSPPIVAEPPPEVPPEGEPEEKQKKSFQVRQKEKPLLKQPTQTRTRLRLSPEVQDLISALLVLIRSVDCLA